MPGIIDGLETARERRSAIAASAKPNALILDFLGQSERLGLAGAASLIAHNEAERTAITANIRRDPQRLDEIQAAVVAAREEAILNALRKNQMTAPTLEHSMPASGIMEFPRGRFEPESKEARLDALFASLME